MRKACLSSLTLWVVAFSLEQKILPLRVACECVIIKRKEVRSLYTTHRALHIVHTFVWIHTYIHTVHKTRKPDRCIYGPIKLDHKGPQSESLRVNNYDFRREISSNVKILPHVILRLNCKIVVYVYNIHICKK